MTAPQSNKLQKHIAFGSVSPTTLRNMNLPIGGRQVVCNYMGSVNLSDCVPSDFKNRLDEHTRRLVTDHAVPWGPARKALNLFFRDLTYNHWMRGAYALDKIEASLELPLDGIVMKKLRQHDQNLEVVWVKALTPAISDTYQEVAARIAVEQSTLRIHLDIDLWAGGVQTA